MKSLLLLLTMVLPPAKLQEGNRNDGWKPTGRIVVSYWDLPPASPKLMPQPITPKEQRIDELERQIKMLLDELRKLRDEENQNRNQS